MYVTSHHVGLQGKNRLHTQTPVRICALGRCDLNFSGFISINVQEYSIPLTVRYKRCTEVGKPS